MERHSFPGHGKQPHGGAPEPPASGSLVTAIDGLTQAVALLAERLAPSEPPSAPVPPSPETRGQGRHLRVVTPTGEGDTPWDQLSVVELRAMLRDFPIDRSSLPAPIENLRRAELVEALRQIGALGSGCERPNSVPTRLASKNNRPVESVPRRQGLLAYSDKHTKRPTALASTLRSAGG
jgi:hypothetical protein